MVPDPASPCWSTSLVFSATKGLELGIRRQWQTNCAPTFAKVPFESNSM